MSAYFLFDSRIVNVDYVDGNDSPILSTLPISFYMMSTIADRRNPLETDRNLEISNDFNI